MLVGGGRAQRLLWLSVRHHQACPERQQAERLHVLLAAGWAKAARTSYGIYPAMPTQAKRMRARETIWQPPSGGALRSRK